MPTIRSTQLAVEFEGQSYSGVYSVSGDLMIARVPGIGSKSAELEALDDPDGSARSLLLEILGNAGTEGRL